MMTLGMLPMDITCSSAMDFCPFMIEHIEAFSRCFITPQQGCEWLQLIQQHHIV